VRSLANLSQTTFPTTKLPAILMNLIAKKMKKTRILKMKWIPNLAVLKGHKVHNHKNPMMGYVNNLKNITKPYIIL